MESEKAEFGATWSVKDSFPPFRERGKEERTWWGRWWTECILYRHTLASALRVGSLATHTQHGITFGPTRTGSDKTNKYRTQWQLEKKETTRLERSVIHTYILPTHRLLVTLIDLHPHLLTQLVASSGIPNLMAEVLRMCEIDLRLYEIWKGYRKRGKGNRSLLIDWGLLKDRKDVSNSKKSRSSPRLNHGTYSPQQDIIQLVSVAS
ncbi:hypothetical protein E2C01_004789 [Portunus trituberculatus]|uniref:Uncharacterized protein n=1 Tax=Portunus trituberculatus TaxID=210409 RepID=A0A5B7CT99_PORTR|nr:hypothetical protein [Portunus trituberculatus]